ncbi:MAG: radical SAM protein [Deltaproteobacteria bacterium]|nr:radical SAM protein [Deltaproteobacteria bacterium]MBW2136535.1 radical SAM protein [Deltaproteobacteria bacterium]
MAFVPSYIELLERGVLEKRKEDALSLMKACSVCPRDCGVDRLEGEMGVCSTGRRARVASYNSHFGEESPLVGRHGSGTIFISSCNLLCGFCQNYEISHGREGVDVEPEQMAEMMIQLQRRGCHNINFVTPTHVVPQILEALPIAVRAGLRVPLVYNSSGYDKKETLEILDGVFDIYMPDFKFWDGKWADRYCKAPDYREVAMGAIKEMHRQVGDLILDERGIAQRGLLVRHLVMPNKVAGTGEILDFLAKGISANTYVNVMDQYRPCGEAYDDEFINRRLKAREFRQAMDEAKKAGLDRLDKRDVIRIIFSP